MAERLTESLIKALKPPPRGERFFWDTELTGFAIKIFAPTRANPKGARTFVLSYWINGTSAVTGSAPGRTGRSWRRVPRQGRSGNGSIAARTPLAIGVSGARRRPCWTWPSAIRPSICHESPSSRSTTTA